MATVEWDDAEAATYDRSNAARFDPAVVGPTVTTLVDLAAGDRALEFAIGTGRVALPLRQAGVEVAGIELSDAMAAALRSKPGGDEIEVTIGDMATTRVEGTFSLVILVFNTIMNVTTQAEQVQVFRNAAAHLSPGGRFVVEVVVPQVRRLPAGELGRVFAMEPGHVGVETFDDPVGQISWSHHWLESDGMMVHHSHPFRYVYPPELDLMAQLAGFRLEHRWGDWDRSEFTADSRSHVSVWRLS